MNYTGMLAEVTGGVEKLPAAKALGLDVMLKTRHCGVVLVTWSVCSSH